MKPMLMTILALSTFCECDLLPIVADSALRNILEMSMAEDMVDVSDGKCTCGNNACSCCVKRNIGLVKVDVCVKVSYLKENSGLEFEVTYNGIVVLKQEVSVKNPPPICNKNKGMKSGVCINFYDQSVQSQIFQGCAQLEVNVVGLKVASASVCITFDLLSVQDMKGQGCANLEVNVLGLKVASASVCLTIDVSLQDREIQGCGNLEVIVLGVKVVSANLGCFTIPFLEKAEFEKVEQTTKPEFGFLGKVKRIIELKQILVETDKEITV